MLGVAVGLGGGGVDVGGLGVAVGGLGVDVGGLGVAVGGLGVAVGGLGVTVGGTDVAVGTGTTVGGMGVVVGSGVGGTEVAVGSSPPHAATTTRATRNGIRTRNLGLTSQACTIQLPLKRATLRGAGLNTYQRYERSDSNKSGMSLSMRLAYRFGRPRQT